MRRRIRRMLNHKPHSYWILSREAELSQSCTHCFNADCCLRTIFFSFLYFVFPYVWLSYFLDILAVCHTTHRVCDVFLCCFNSCFQQKVRKEIMYSCLFPTIIFLLSDFFFVSVLTTKSVWREREWKIQTQK